MTNTIILRKHLTEDDAHLIKLYAKYSHLNQIDRIVRKYEPITQEELSSYSMEEVKRLCRECGYELFEIDGNGNEKEIFPEEVEYIFKK